MYQKTVLPAGVTVVTEEKQTFPSVAVGFWVNVGSKWESPAQAGASHLLEHLLFKGTSKYSAREIAETFDSVGGQLNAFTSKEHTCYYARVLTDHFALAIDVLSEMFLRPKLSPKDVVREKMVVQEEINMYEDSPDELVHDLLAKTVWPQHPLGRRILGDKKSVLNLAPEEVHSFFRQHYRPTNLVISVVGNIKHEQVVSTCEKYFNSTEVGQAKRLSQEAPGYNARSDTFIRDLEQVHLCLGAPGVAINDDRLYTMDVANCILGGGLSSRLFQRIREERGMAYSIFSYHSAYQDNGLLTIYVGLNRGNIKPGIDLIRQELEAMANMPVTIEELKRAKQQIWGNFLLGLESTTNRMIRLAKQELSLKRWVSLDEVQAKINAVTATNIQEQCLRLFQPDTMAVVSLGPLDTEVAIW
ncbi:MAG TPA: pitrilysin family protein [bacterium]|nr:pitrilysin family protein [bacterium]